nr:MAG TPA: hypothetical protein [Caudoviricetes sp.]DAU37044.1 MAG TPA: hypothetical protein [Caudoviricetes sp.]DAW78347.1 MAG TPA: hypothetical protein [Caudoviricetes sp.]DAZ31885.1 MAG TPA: hypothetical protein [Caudoviricetes sp.]
MTRWTRPCIRAGIRPRESRPPLPRLQSGSTCST